MPFYFSALLANCNDLMQVIDWLDSHGEAFLHKNTSIGKSLQRAKSLQRSHEHFEIVAQVSDPSLHKTTA